MKSSWNNGGKVWASKIPKSEFHKQKQNLSNHWGNQFLKPTFGGQCGDHCGARWTWTRHSSTWPGSTQPTPPGSTSPGTIHTSVLGCTHKFGLFSTPVAGMTNHQLKHHDHPWFNQDCQIKKKVGILVILDGKAMDGTSTFDDLRITTFQDVMITTPSSSSWSPITSPSSSSAWSWANPPGGAPTLPEQLCDAGLVGCPPWTRWASLRGWIVNRLVVELAIWQ